MGKYSEEQRRNRHDNDGQPSVASSSLSRDVRNVSIAELPYIAVTSVKGSVWHEPGHNLKLVLWL